jgi:hypothetical protein
LRWSRYFTWFSKPLRRSAAVSEYTKLTLSRHQAKGIPDLLSAPRSQEEDLELSKRGYYSNGVYLASATSQNRPSAEDADEEPYGDEDEDEDYYDENHSDAGSYDPDDVTDATAPHVPPPTPQAAYRANLLARFDALRSQLAQQPPLGPVQRLGPNQLVSLPRARPALQAWLYQLRTADPVPAQLASMQQESVLSALELCARQIQTGADGTPAIGARVGTWIFALLARLGGAGTLDNDGVSVVREMGKRAVAVVKGVPDEVSGYGRPGGGEDEAQPEDDRDREDEGEGEVEAGGDDEQAKLRAAKERLLGKLAAQDEEESSQKAMTDATLDMIITLTGEVFGQRDLLEFREAWK